MKKYLRIGKIISLHGIRGELKVFPMTDDIKRFDSLKEFYIIYSDDAVDEDFVNLMTYEKENVKYIKKTAIIKVKGIDSIESATKYIGGSIYVSRDKAIELETNEYFVVDLIGLTTTGELSGKVVDVIKTKANDILVVSSIGKEVLIPLVDEYIKSVDLQNGNIELRNIEGLI